MTSKSRRHFLTLMGATALAGCASPSLVTRDGNDPFEGGIGGTGIVGVVTGFGSILINGLKVELTSQTVFENALGALGAEDLHAGHSVTINARRTADGIIADRVTQDLLLVGLLHHGQAGLSVNGIPVTREPGGHGQGQIGHRVAVSGAWTATGVLASRIDPAPHGPDIISGTANREPHVLTVGQTVIEARQPRADLDGSFVVALGVMKDGAFAAEQVAEGRFNKMPSLRQLSVDGFLEPSETAPGFRVAGLGHNFARDTRLAAIGPRRALYFGKYDGLFGANRGYLMPSNFETRRQLLNPGLETSGAELLVRI